MWHFYILECQKGSLYTGITKNLKRRFQEHVSGNGANFSRLGQPKRIAYFEAIETEILARQREAQVKRWSRAKKQALIEGKFQRLRELSISRD